MKSNNLAGIVCKISLNVDGVKKQHNAAVSYKDFSDIFRQMITVDCDRTDGVENRVKFDLWSLNATN